MKKFLLIFLMLISVSSFAQEWIEFKVDSLLTVSLPDSSYTVRDTLGQHIISLQTGLSLIMIQRVPNTGEHAVNISDKKELLTNYTAFQKGLIESHKGKLISQQFIEKGDLQLTQFYYSVSVGEEKQVRHALVVFINENWYAIQFWEVEGFSESRNAESRKKLFNSVKFSPGLSLQNQMSDTTEGTRAYKFGFVFGYLLGVGLLIGLVILVISMIRKLMR